MEGCAFTTYGGRMILHNIKIKVIDLNLETGKETTSFLSCGVTTDEEITTIDIETAIESFLKDKLAQSEKNPEFIRE